MGYPVFSQKKFHAWKLNQRNPNTENSRMEKPVILK